MSNANYVVALRTRLHQPQPQPLPTCQHHNHTHTHTHLPGQWLRAMGHPTQTEQHIPALDYHDATGHHQARLDLVTTIHQNTYYVDVSVAATHTTDPTRRQQRATSDGAAARDREADKRRQYQLPPIHPCIGG